MVTTRSKQTNYKSPITKTITNSQKWEIIYNNLKQLLLAQHSQIDSLLQERKLLQQRLLNHHYIWESDLYLLNDRISQLRRQLELSKLANLVDIAKAHLMIGSKHRDAFLSNLKLEDARCELEDFKACFDILSHRCPSDQEDIDPDWLYEILRAKGGKNSSPEAASNEHCKMLEREIAALKREYEKLSLKNSSEVSSLRAEIKFAWNQYNEKEGNFTNQLQAKNEEVKKANEKIVTLLARLEKLQSSNFEKDKTVSTLRANIARLEEEAREKDERDKLNKLEAEANLKNGEIASLSKEVNLLRSKAARNTPVLNRCTTEPSSSRLRNHRNGSSRGCAVPKEEASSAQLASGNGGSKRGKRNHEEVINVEETPRLFTSHFKIPKLKSQSPRTR